MLSTMLQIDDELDTMLIAVMKPYCSLEKPHELHLNAECYAAMCCWLFLFDLVMDMIMNAVLD